MRSEQEMFDLIRKVASRDERIRAVYMNGSRANPKAPKDIFQDYDIVYVVTEIKPFIGDKSWIKVFGDTVVLQEPDINVLYDEEPVDIREHYAYLMQFMDGNRIDLSLITQEVLLREYGEDKLTLPLLDKDDILPTLPAPSDEDYYVKKPSQIVYDHCCNEFWWVTPYIAKGLWRGEILYAMDHLNCYVRPMLLRMLSWHAGILTDFAVSVGKNNKYLDCYLPKDIWEKLINTYPVADPEAVWEAVFIMGELFRETAGFVANHLGFQYDEDQDQRTTEFIRDIYKLPKDAKEIR